NVPKASLEVFAVRATGTDLAIFTSRRVLPIQRLLDRASPAQRAVVPLRRHQHETCHPTAGAGHWLVEVGIGHFDVIAEDLVVADFEAFDAGALALGPLESGQVTPCVMGRVT